MAYKDLLAYLVKLAGIVPQLIPILLRIVDDFQQAIALLPQAQAHTFGALADFSPTAEEIELENGLIVSSGVSHLSVQQPRTYGAIGDGTLIQVVRQLWLFIKDNPELMQVIQLLLAQLIKLPKPA